MLRAAGSERAGKTTTIEILEGLLPQTSGEVEILDKTWNAQEASNTGSTLRGRRACWPAPS